LDAVGSGFEIDLARLSSYLSTYTSIDPRGLIVRQFRGGQSNPTYLLETSRAHCVLRRRPPGALLASAHALDREYRVLKALHAAKVPLPEPLAYCQDAAVIGTEFYLMAYVPGRIFWDNSLPDLTPAERAAVYDSANATLAQLHGIIPEVVGLADYGRPGNYFARQIARWSKQ
jgi:aminoglycoside phosphotransferase (APT) family kinase protein